jgi:glutathione S-transferase
MALLTVSLDYEGEDSTDEQEELALALRSIARKLDDYYWVLGDRYGVRDVNGNTIGYWETAPSPHPEQETRS